MLRLTSITLLFLCYTFRSVAADWSVGDWVYLKYKTCTAEVLEIKPNYISFKAGPEKKQYLVIVKQLGESWSWPKRFVVYDIESRTYMEFCPGRFNPELNRIVNENFMIDIFGLDKVEETKKQVATDFDVIF